jgi:hypothetical protein
MLFYECWELITAFLAVPGGHPEHPIVLPPDAGIMPPIYYPPGVWPPIPPDAGIMPPIYYPPEIWDPVFPTPPIYIPPTPPERPDSPEPVIPPDLASPGFWAHVVATDGSTRWGWVQLSWNTNPGHVPLPPADGLPGYWLVAATGTYGLQPTWIPTW